MRIVQITKATVRKIFALFGLDVRRVVLSSAVRTSHEVALRLAVKNGLFVNTVIDVGAAYGNWTKMCLKYIPQAKYALIEPLDLYEDWLRPLLSQYSGMVYIKAAAASKNGRAIFYQHEDWVGSSLYRETEGPEVDGATTEVDVCTIDEIVRQQQLPSPFLIKIDVQGAELQVLEGALNTLLHTEYLIVETSLFQFFKKGPLIHDVIEFMQRHGFVIYDMLQFQYRPLDYALGQVDLAFVPIHSTLRQEHVYASAAQRRKQTKQIISKRCATKHKPIR